MIDHRSSLSTRQTISYYLSQFVIHFDILPELLFIKYSNILLNRLQTFYYSYNMSIYYIK